MKLRITKSKIDNSDNLLPLVNIIFLLLIFFMMAGIIEKTKELNDISLATVTIEEYQENDQPVLFINKNGQLILDDTPVTLENLKNNLESVSNEKKLLIAADGDLISQKLNEVLTELHDSKISKVTLITLKNE
ncbi:MAG: biopolymer transporter ExbD [Pseudomonadota bacterium]|nr:biopolymer transporter ExbD [Pseudomonadota bacterium]